MDTDGRITSRWFGFGGQHSVPALGLHLLPVLPADEQ